MKRQEFEQSLRSLCPKELKPYLAEAMPDILDFEGRYGREYYPHHVSLVIGLLRSCIPAFKANLIADEQTVAAPIETESPITAQLLAEQIKPWVEDIRQRLFSSKSPPFNSVADAQKWWSEAERKVGEWEAEVEKWHERVDEQRERQAKWDALWQAMLEKYPHIKDGIKKWSAMTKQGIKVEFPTREEWRKLDEAQRHVNLLEVGEPPEQDEQIKVYEALLDEVLEISKVTGFRVKSVDMYILAGTSPILPLYTFGIIRGTHSLPDGRTFLNRFARVTIRGELRYEELRSLYRGIRQELGAARTKNFTPKHLQLYEMIRKGGDIPKRKGTVGAFWLSKMKEWNRLHPHNRYETWKGIQLAYKRIMDQLERKMIVKGSTKR